MIIKYVNVCLDKDAFKEKLKSEVLPEFKNIEYKPRYHASVIGTGIYFIFVLIYMILFCINWKAGNSTNMIIDAVCFFLFLFDFIFGIYKIVKNYKAYVDNVMINSIGANSYKLCNYFWETMSFEEIVVNETFSHVNDCCKLLWIIYTKTIVLVEYEPDDNILRITYLDTDTCEETITEINGVWLNGTDGFNTVSVIKDGIILSKRNDVLPNAIKSIVISSFSST